MSIFQQTFFIFLALLIQSCNYRNAGSSADTAVAFSGTVQTIMEKRCAKCHSGGMANGGLYYIESPDLLIANGLVARGNPGSSKLYQKLVGPAAYTFSGEQMPKGGPYLTATELAGVESWIRQMPGRCDTLPASTTVSFATDIVPILNTTSTITNKRCTGCHRSGGSGSSAFAMNSDGTTGTVNHSAVVGKLSPGYATSSLIYKKLTMSSPPSGEQMPKGVASPYRYYLPTDTEISKIATWIDECAQNN